MKKAVFAGLVASLFGGAIYLGLTSEIAQATYRKDVDGKIMQEVEVSESVILGKLDALRGEEKSLATAIADYTTQISSFQAKIDEANDRISQIAVEKAQYEDLLK